MKISKSDDNTKIVDSNQNGSEKNRLFTFSDADKNILDERRSKHLKGESKSFSLEEVKAHARNSRN